MLKQVWNIDSLEINNAQDFGECLHTAGSEPFFFYQTAYKYNFVQGLLTIDHAKRSTVHVDSMPSGNEWMSYVSPIVIDEHDKAHLSKLVNDNRWECSIACWTLNTFLIEVILDLKII